MSDFERLRSLALSDPEQFKKLMGELRKKTVIPHAGQRPVIESNARFKVMNCGRRFGKTVVAAKIMIAMSRQPNKMLWWLSPQYRITKRGYEEIIRQLPDGVLAKPAPPSSNFDAGRAVILLFKNGTKMEFYSAERPEGMLGAAVDFVVLDEAARMGAAIWNQTVSPTLIDHLGGALIISTPRGRNWFYNVWLKGQDPDEPEWASWTFTTQDNPTLPEGEADRMAADMPRLEADQEIYAKWLAAGSSVFTWDQRALQPNIILPSCMVEQSPPKGHVALGIDLARTNDYTVLYGANMNDRRNCYFERMQAITWPEQKRRIRRAVRSIMRAGAENVMLIMDSTGVGDPIVEDMEAEGYDVVPINFTTHKTNMVRLLAKDLEEAQAFILTDGQVIEFENYMMNMTAAGRMTYSAPEGQNDDVVSAKMLSHWGCVNEGFGDVTFLGLDTTVEEVSENREFWDVPDEDIDGDYSDLIDEGDAIEAIGYERPQTAEQLLTMRPPTLQELMARPNLWF